MKITRIHTNLLKHDLNIECIIKEENELLFSKFMLKMSKYNENGLD